MNQQTGSRAHTHTHKSLAVYHKHTQNHRAPTATTTNNTTNTNQRETMDNRVVLAAAHLRVTPAILGLLDVVHWADFTATDWQLNVLRSRMVTDLASYPESAQREILATEWGNEMVMARVAAVPAAPAGLWVQEPSDDGVDEDENEETVPVATGTTQEAARLTVPAPGGPIPTPDLLATTSIEQSITSSTVSRFPVDGTASDDDDDDDEGNDGEGNDGKGGEPTFEALHLLASDLLAVVVEEGSSSPRLMRMHW